MPAFIVDITKRVGEVLYEWGNRYLVNGTDLTDAASAVAIIAAAESNIHSELVTFVQGRVATVTANDGVYVTVPLDLTGQIATATPWLPPITTDNIEVLCEGLGRPGRKYYHPMLDCGQANTAAIFQWLGSYLTEVKDQVEQMINDCQDNGTPIIKNLDSGWLPQVSVQKSFGYHQFTKQSPRPPD